MNASSAAHEGGGKPNGDVALPAPLDALLAPPESYADEDEDLFGSDMDEHERDEAE